MQDWLWMTAANLGHGIGTGEIEPAELTKTYLDAIQSHEFADRIYARITYDRALSEAAAASKRAKSGQRLGPLDGVPISWKDLYDTAGVATEHGSALLKGRVPDKDAEVLRNATAAGLICLGKTHQTELAFSGLGYNPVTASPPCKNDHKAVSGGSSSGAATSVAFGLAAIGVGSDTGGSVRVPSAWNDLVGLKTAAGRLSCRGVLPLCARFDTVGPLCRSVEDASLILTALEGSPEIDLAGASLQGARFLICETIALDNVDPKIIAGFNSAIELLQSAGAIVERREIASVEPAMALAGPLYASEAYATWQKEIEANPDTMFQAVRERFQGGLEFSATQYIQAWQKLDALRLEYAAETAGYDAVLVPTTPNLPPKLERCEQDIDYFTAQNLLALRNTRIGNLMGLSVLTLPTGLPSCGISLMAPAMAEDHLLRLGSAAETALS